MSSSEETLFLTLGRLEGKVDTLLTLQKGQEEQLKDHDIRIRGLEHSRAFIMGISAVVGAAVSAAMNFIIKLYSN